MLLPLKSNLFSSTFTWYYFFWGVYKKNWNASEFFYHAHYYICKSEKIKNTAIFLNWYEALSLLKIILVTYKSLKETFFKKKKDKKNELVLTFVLFLIILK